MRFEQSQCSTSHCDFPMGNDTKTGTAIVALNNVVARWSFPPSVAWAAMYYDLLVPLYIQFATPDSTARKAEAAPWTWHEVNLPQCLQLTLTVRCAQDTFSHHDYWPWSVHLTALTHAVNNFFLPKLMKSCVQEICWTILVVRVGLGLRCGSAGSSPLAPGDPGQVQPGQHIRQCQHALSEKLSTVSLFLIER